MDADIQRDSMSIANTGSEQDSCKFSELGTSSTASLSNADTEKQVLEWPDLEKRAIINKKQRYGLRAAARQHQFFTYSCIFL
jgi:hypothetical protein